MTKKIALTNHSKARADERMNQTLFNLSNKEEIFKNALKNGMYFETYKTKDKTSDFRKFLNEKKKDRTRIILYKRYIFIVDKTCRVLITLYPVPEKFISIYDKIVGDVGLSKPFIVYFRDRNTKAFKPVKNFKNDKLAQEFVFSVFYPNVPFNKMQEFLKIAHNKKRYKIERAKKMPQNLPNPLALRF